MKSRFADANGVILTSSGFGNRFMFTGREYDNETGLYYYRARFYNPHIGRFMQTDPIGYAGGLNLYTYVDNNPLNWIDPWGLAKLTIRVKKAQPPGQRDSKGGWGHAWTEIQNDDGTSMTRGSYPAGVYDDSKRNGSESIKKTYDISQAKADKAKKYIDNYKGPWRAVSENCTDFVYHVADEAGVDLPGSDWGIDTPDGLAEDFKGEQEIKCKK